MAEADDEKGSQQVGPDKPAPSAGSSSAGGPDPGGKHEGPGNTEEEMDKAQHRPANPDA